jgi:parallel beta-helix repeat protein
MRPLLVLFLAGAALASPNPDGTVSDVKGLVSAVAALGPGKTILLAPGTYVLPSRLSLAGSGTASSPVLLAALRGPGSAIIDANGAEEAILVSGASFLRIEGLSITGGACHAIKVDPPSTDVAIANNRLYDNTRTTNLNSQVSAVKGSPGSARVTIENNLVEQLTSYGGDNFQGIDCNAGIDWIVRGNTVRDIRGASLAGSGIQFKSGSTGTLIENNFVLRCGLNGIVYGGFGKPSLGGQTFEHVGGVVRNNVVIDCVDAGITVINTSDGKVVNNTLFNNGVNPDVRIAARNLEFRNNILDWQILLRDGTMAARINNVVLSKPSDGSWFVNASGADFRLRAGAPLAPDLGANLSKKAPRPSGGRNARSEIKLGHDALARGDLGRAYRHFEAAAADGGDEEQLAQVRDSMKKIEQAAAGRLKEAQALEAIGEAADAVAAYQDVLREFAGLPAAQEARQRMEVLKKAPPGGKK